MKVTYLLLAALALLGGCRKAKQSSSYTPESVPAAKAETPENGNYHERIRAQAEEMNRLFMSGDLDRFITYMPAKVVMQMGGAPAVKRMVQPELAQMRQQIEKTTLGTISPIVAEADCLAAFVPVEMVHRLDGSRFLQKTYYVASSEDGGVTWKFISSQGKRDQEAFLKSLFPRLTSQIPFPKCGTDQIK